MGTLRVSDVSFVGTIVRPSRQIYVKVGIFYT